MKKTAVIIVSWNCREELRRCLYSVTRCSSPQTDIIVVDNASSDDTAKMIKVEFPDIQFIPLDKNIGFGRANNIGLQKTDADFIFILNPDTIVLQDTIPLLTDFLVKNPQCGLAAPAILDDRRRVVPSTFHFPDLINYWTEHSLLLPLFEKIRNPGPDKKNFSKIRKIDWATGAAFMLRREHIPEPGLFDEHFFMYSEDADLCKRLEENNVPRFYVPSAQVIHSHRGSSKKARTFTIFHLFNSMVLYYRAHKGRMERFFLRLSISTDMCLRYIYLLISSPGRKSSQRDNEERKKGYLRVLKTLHPFRKISRNGFK